MFKLLPLSWCVKIRAVGDQAPLWEQIFGDSGSQELWNAMLGPHSGGAGPAEAGRAGGPLSETCWYCLAVDNTCFLLIGLSPVFHLSTSLQNELILKCQIQIGPGGQSYLCQPRSFTNLSACTTSAVPRQPWFAALYTTAKNAFLCWKSVMSFPPKALALCRPLHLLPSPNHTGLLTLLCLLTEAFPGVLKITAPSPRSVCSFSLHRTSQSHKAELLDLSLYRHFALSPTTSALRLPITMPCPV